MTDDIQREKQWKERSKRNNCEKWEETVKNNQIGLERMAEVNLLQRINKLENTIIIKEEMTLKKENKKKIKIGLFVLQMLVCLVESSS